MAPKSSDACLRPVECMPHEQRIRLSVLHRTCGLDSPPALSFVSHHDEGLQHPIFEEGNVSTFHRFY